MYVAKRRAKPIVRTSGSSSRAPRVVATNSSSRSFALAVRGPQILRRELPRELELRVRVAEQLLELAARSTSAGGRRS